MLLLEPGDIVYVPKTVLADLERYLELVSKIITPIGIAELGISTLSECQGRGDRQFVHRNEHRVNSTVTGSKNRRWRMFRARREQAEREKFRENYCHALWGLLNSETDTAKCYEGLLTNLNRQNASHPLRSILITSAKPEEGKTTVTLALALAMILSGKKVLIVEADLRKPRLHRLLNVKNEQGMTDILCGDRGVSDVVQTVDLVGEAELKRSISVITSGRKSSNLFKMIGDLKLKFDVAYLKNIYDVVLIDTPPILAVNDALLLAPAVDGTILVLRAGAVSEKEAIQSKERLKQAGCHILGVVMNRFDEKIHGSSFMPYHNYY